VAALVERLAARLTFEALGRRAVASKSRSSHG
jgi:hypothetical protein